MQWILRFRVCIIICLAVTLITTAVVFSVLRAVLPYATGYKNEIQQEVSHQIGLPVEIQSIDAAIHWFSPRLKLIGVSIFDEKNKVPLFNFEEAFVELDVIASILRAEIIVDDVGLVGADISIEKLSDNEWTFQGIKFTSEGDDKGKSELPDKFLYMLQNSDYLLHDSNIYYQDHTGEKLNLSLLNVNIDVKNDFNNHDIKFSMNLPEEYGDDLAVVANLQGDIDSLDGDIYIEAHQVNVNQWNKKFKLIQEYSLDTVLDINLWATLDKNRLQSLFTQLSSHNVSIRNNATAKTWKTNYLTTKIRYVYDNEHWNVALSDFYFGEKGQPQWHQAMSLLASDDKEHYYLAADYLHVADLQTITEVFLSKKQLIEFEELKSYQIQADVFNLSLKLPKDATKQQLLDKLYLDASVVNLSMQDKKNEISLAGLDSSILYDNKQATIDVATQNARVEIKTLFREPLIAETIQGKLTLDYDKDNWQLTGKQVQLKNNHINTFSRLDIQLSSENNIVVDVQTDFYDAFGKYAGQYIPVGIMNPNLVDWLDMAVTDGYVPAGSFILHGDLNDFPYNDKNGVFQVLFSAQDVSMQFLEEWPLLTETSATIKFNNQSLFVYNANGKTQEASLFNGSAEILDLNTPHLTVQTEAKSNNDDLQSYIWNSALDEIMGDAMRLFQFEGESHLNLKLEVPLNEEVVEVDIDGHLDFIDTEIYYPALGYDINGINGVVDFSEDSIFADSMQAIIQNQAVTINAFTQDGDSGREVVFHLDGVMGADYLLQRYDWIPEQWISGQSLWAVDIGVPYKPQDYLVHIKADSYLEDVVFQVSDKLHKPSSNKLAFSADINVLDQNGLQVVSKAGPVNEAQADVFELYAVRDENDIWDFAITSEYMTGKGEFTEGLDKNTQVKLNLKEIDLHAMFVTEKGGDAQPLIPTDFPPLSWKLEKLLWDDWTFTDISVETDWHKHGMLINTLSLKGPEMTFDARGTWLTSWRGSHETVLQGSITSSNFGATLAGLGFERSIDRCKYEATFDSKWPAQPYAFSWANMKGKTSFEMKDGEILEADPGAGGRLLGLLNIFKLTNRLAFDFDDVTREGFSFDYIKGDFEFVNGDGSLKNFDVSAPAADINMFGSIGLLKRDYGLLMRVKPHTDTLTFAGGALLGGVAIGAGLALIQKIFDLGVIGHNVYSITGSWDQPVIEKIVERTQDSEAAIEDDDEF